MKYLKKLVCLLTITLLLGGCDFMGSDMDDISIYTTTYPIHYLITSLYGEHSKVYSIYPTGVTLDNYKLSNRKLEEYSKSDLFVFNSLDKDRDYAVKMINLNRHLKVIDVATGMKYENAIEELWLNPNDYLMMAENIKKGLGEYIRNPYLKEEIDKKFDDLEYHVSKLAADLTETIGSAKYKTIVVDDDMFLYLEKFGLHVISLEENDNLNSNKIEEVKELIAAGKVKYIFSGKDKSNNTVNSFIEEKKVELVSLNVMHSIDGGITNSNDNYISVMSNNTNLLKKELYKD